MHPEIHTEYPRLGWGCWYLGPVKHFECKLVIVTLAYNLSTVGD